MWQLWQLGLILDAEGGRDEEVYGWEKYAYGANRRMHTHTDDGRANGGEGRREGRKEEGGRKEGGKKALRRQAAGCCAAGRWRDVAMAL